MTKGKIKSNIQKLYNTKFGTRNKSGMPKQVPSNNFTSLEKNPVIHFYLKANGGEFKTSTGGVYESGNPMYDKYNGEYHIHLNGEICAGTHKFNVMNPYNMLTPADSHLGKSNKTYINTRVKARTTERRHNKRPRARNRVPITTATSEKRTAHLRNKNSKSTFLRKK
jgi:hypothetical protein